MSEPRSIKQNLRAGCVATLLTLTAMPTAFAQDDTAGDTGSSTLPPGYAPAEVITSKPAGEMSSPWGMAALAPAAGPGGVPAAPAPESFLTPPPPPTNNMSSSINPPAGAPSTAEQSPTPPPGGTVALPMQGSSQQNAAYAATMGGNAPMPMNATNSSPGQQPITGIAPPLTGNELDSELNSQAGPPLPDAQLTGHRADASLEMDLKNRSALLDLQTSVNDKLLGVMKQDEELRIAYARTQMPITVFPTIDSDGATAEQALTNSQNSGSSTASSGTAGTAGATVPTAPDTGTTTTAPTPVPVPVVYAIGGIGSNLTADILIPYSGAREVTVGSNLPNGLKVVKIDPFSVLVRSSDGNIYSLPMGRSVPSTPPAPPQAPTAIQQDMSPVTFQAPAPPTVGGTAPANGSGWSQ